MWVTDKQHDITTRWSSGQLRDLSGDAEVVYRRSAKPLALWKWHSTLIETVGLNAMPKALRSRSLIL
ncbi:hypothetical protein MICAD_3540020 [Microcystis aeruginosa PCC 7941]|nr:hypothetical protein MICAD_3540020 [Microcystis aeruginosa PCC 7941]